MLPKTLLITNKTNIRYLSNFTGTHGYIVIHNKKYFFFTDARYHSEAKSIIPSNYKIIDITQSFDKSWKTFLRKFKIRRIGIEGASMSYKFWRRLKKISRGVRLIDIGDHINEKRVSKKPHELAAIAHSQNITDRIFKALKTWLKVGVDEKEIAWQIKVFANKFGADDISFPPIVAINEHSASPHHSATNKKLRKGDLLLIDMGVIYKGYCSDMTRMLFTKAPTHEEEKVYNVVLNAQKTAFKRLKVGVRGKNIDSIARNIIRQAGYGENFGHSLGHGVGLDVHELPNLSKKCNGKLPMNSVVTIEPGIYLPGKFGVRIEDMVILGEKRAYNLTKSPKTIQESTIRLK